jgi:large subunit ribosomal protein L25
MADAVTIQVEARDPAKNKGTGSRVSRRLRQKGRIPAIVYGHKQAPTPISMARDDVWQMIKNATHVAQLKIGDATEMVLVRDVQWDHLGKEILHLDFARVSADETIETEVPLELHGAAPGTSEGGVLEHVVHTVKISCRATAIPEHVRLELAGLHVGQGLHVRDLNLPEGVKALADPDLLLVHVVARAAAAEPTPAAEPGAAEPELIGRKAEDKEKEGKEG